MPRERKQRLRRILPNVRHDAVPGRVRFSHPRLHAGPKLVRPIVEALRARSGVHSVKASAATGSILVEFGSPATKAELARLIADAAAGKPTERARPDPPPEANHVAWHARSSGEALKELCSDRKRGLSEPEAARLRTVLAAHLDAETFLIDRLKKAAAHLVINLETGPHDRIALLLKQNFSHHSPPFFASHSCDSCYSWWAYPPPPR